MRFVEVGARRAVKLSDADVPAINERKKCYDESFLCLSGTLKKRQVKVRLQLLLCGEDVIFLYLLRLVRLLDFLFFILNCFPWKNLNI